MSGTWPGDGSAIGPMIDMSGRNANFNIASPLPTGPGMLMSPNPSAMSTSFAGSMFNPNGENLSFHNTDAFATDFSLPTAFPMPTDQGILMIPSFTGPMSNFNEGNVNFNNASIFGMDPYFPLAVPMPMDQDLSAISYLPWEPNQTIQPGLPAVGSSFLPFTPPGPRRTACPWAGCMESFVRQSDLRRHHEAVHLGIKYNCMFPGCANNRGTGYCRLEKLRTHQREKHGIVLA